MDGWPYTIWDSGIGIDPSPCFSSLKTTQSTPFHRIRNGEWHIHQVSVRTVRFWLNNFAYGSQTGDHIHRTHHLFSRERLSEGFFNRRFAIHFHMFTSSSHLHHIFITSSSHLHHIFTSSHLHIFSSFLSLSLAFSLPLSSSVPLSLCRSVSLSLCLSVSLSLSLSLSVSVSCPLSRSLSFFFFSLLRPRAVPTRRHEVATLSHETKFECQKLMVVCEFGWSGGNPFARNEGWVSKTVFFCAFGWSC